jgi:hypothetical protein
MPETGHTSKRLYANLLGTSQNGLTGRRQSWHRRIPGDIVSGASHDDLNDDHVPEKREAPARGGANPSAVTPLMTGCGNRILYLEAPNCRWRFESFKPQSRRRPLSSTPGAASAAASQSCALQICIRHRRVDVKSSTGSEHTAPRRAYFFFFAATLRLAGAFFFAAVFAFVAFFTILPSWPKPSGGVASAPARIASTASRLLQAERKKNLSH